MVAAEHDLGDTGRLVGVFDLEGDLVCHLDAAGDLVDRLQLDAERMREPAGTGPRCVPSARRSPSIPSSWFVDSSPPVGALLSKHLFESENQGPDRLPVRSLCDSCALTLGRPHVQVLCTGARDS